MAHISLPGAVFRRELQRDLPMAVRAAGAEMEDANGNLFLDASGGPLVVTVGHGRKEVAWAVYEQILACDYAHPTMFTTGPVEALAERLKAHAPPGIERFYFMTSGSEAVETAVKCARQVHVERGEPERYRLVSRWKSYHGLTLGALSATGRTPFRTPFAPLLPEVHHIPAPYCYRCPFGTAYPRCGLRCAEALEDLLQSLGPKTVSAFMAETVGGATIAAVVPPPDYYKRIREICDAYGVLLILDEVLCGLGRTGRWFASEHFEVSPDMVTLGKGLAGGTLAISAVGVRGAHVETIQKGSGAFVHGGTFSHHPVAAAAANAVLELLEGEDLVHRVATVGPRIGQALSARLKDHPHVGDIRGIGFLWGIEYVKDKASRTPFPRRERLTERLWQRLFEEGILLYKATGLAGTDGDALLFGPPYVITEEEIQRVVDALGTALDKVLGH